GETFSRASDDLERHRPLRGLLRKRRGDSLLRELDAGERSREGRQWGDWHYREARRGHDSVSPSGSNGTAESLPSAFFRRISTRPSASSSCFWHSRERATPSSKSFMASSRESCGLSRRRTTSSRRARERSKSGFLGGSGFFGADWFTGLICVLEMLQKLRTF